LSDAEDAEAVQQALQSEQVRLHGENVWAEVGGSASAGIVLAAMLWRIERPAVIDVWLALLALTVLARTLADVALRRERSRGAPPAAMLARLHRHSLAHGITWGLASVVLYPSGHLIYEALLALVIVGMTAGCLAVTLFDLRAGLYFNVLATAPLVWRLASQGEDIHWALAALSLLFLAVVTMVGLRGWRGTRDNIALRVASARHAQALYAAKLDAERASRAKSEFLSRMSHELRTPLNAVLGFAQLLSADPEHALSARQQTQLGEIVRGGRHLLDLVNDVLDLARIEAGRMEVQLGRVEAQPLVAECISLLAPMAQARQVTLSSTGGAFAVRADRRRLSQVVLNLVSNAIKFNREGGAVRIDCVRSDERVRISVHDTGRGMSPEQRQRLFRAFERTDVYGASEDGAGIGLVVSKELVELMNGRIGLRSEPGAGSTFWVELDEALE